MATESSRIFVKGLPPTITEVDLRKHFAAKGEITDVKCFPNRRIGYVGYRSPQEAATAVKYFNRSFIRMSKITVELARPIADPSLSKRRESKDGQPPARILGIPSDQSSKKEAVLDNAKKRKREAIDESDPKLREFLDVMQPTKSSASNMEGGAMDEPAPKFVAVAADKDGSDDEYESLPARSKKLPVQESRRTIHPETDTVKVPAREGNHIVGQESRDERPVQDPDGAKKSTVPGGVDMDDDNWLRQRTNRLLDLVDDDEIMPASAEAERSPSQSPGPEDPPQQGVAEADDDIKIQTPPPSDDRANVGSQYGVTDEIRRTARLFVRNLPYSATEDDLRSHFAQFGDLEEVHVPTDAAKKNRGICFVWYTQPDDAVSAFLQSDRSSFQGRILHVLPASAKRDHELDEFALSKLPLKKQNLIKKRNKAAESRFNWNALFMSQDAVNDSFAQRLGITKAELLDPTSSDAAVKQAIAETSTIQDTKAYFAANGINLEAFKSAERGDDAILVKNFAFGTKVEEIRNLFEEHGQVLKVLMPPTGTIAIVHFAKASDAKAAFAKLAYRRFKDSILFLEKAPKNLMTSQQVTKNEEPSGVQKLSTSELLEREDEEPAEASSSLFVKNLHWDTDTAELAAAFQHLEGFRSATVKTKKDPSKPGQVLSLGFGFVAFSNKESALAALKVMDGHVLRAHKLQVRASHRGHDAAEERRQLDDAKKAAGQARTRIIIKNLPFQVTKKEVRSLLSSYGQLKSVRIPKKFHSTGRGFAFADFVSPKQAEAALLALQDTHLLGRKLILQYAEADAIDPEEEIARMQRKVGGQASKVALQQLIAGGSRKKVTLAGNEGEGEL
ncbi:hypothetical protein F5X96DRAFT_677544 [Biscogniauxia mediterranea]|nr:hypothetical protein F5X96DRAFT_677544 [Biscogniauxia mediterranea]